MNDKKIMNSKSIQSKKLEEVRREDVCTVPEALHYMFFGLEPGSEYDVRLANKLISDLVNQCKTSVWYKEKNLEWGTIRWVGYRRGYSTFLTKISFGGTHLGIANYDSKTHIGLFKPKP